MSQVALPFDLSLSGRSHPPQCSSQYLGCVALLDARPVYHVQFLVVRSWISRPSIWCGVLGGLLGRCGFVLCESTQLHPSDSEVIHCCLFVCVLLSSSALGVQTVFSAIKRLKWAIWTRLLDFITFLWAAGWTPHLGGTFW